MDQRIINLYDRFTHGGMTRRDFLDRLAELAGSAAAAVALLPLLQNDYAQAAIVAPDDNRLATDRISYDLPKGKIAGYLVRMKEKGKRPAVIVIHENRGLNPHIEDVARRLATEGFLAFAPDLLSLVGGTPPNEDQARELHPKINQDDAVAALVAAVPVVKNHAELTGKVGAVGFCFGGLMINRLAASSPQLDAGVAYYGRQVPADQVPNIRATLLLHYAENDDRGEFRHSRLRGGAQGQQQEVHAPHLSGHAARLQQRHRRRPLQQGRRRPGLVPHRRLLQGAARGSAARVLSARTPLATGIGQMLYANRAARTRRTGSW